MKRFLALLLTVIMTFSISSPAFSAYLTNWGSQVPVVSISGDGEPLYDANGNQIFKTTEILNSFTQREKSEIVEAVFNVIKPYIFEGLLTDNWDNFYAALQEEFTKIFKDSLLTDDGEAPAGTGLSQSRKDEVANNLLRDVKLEKGCYQTGDYMFYYDWRLDPMAIADEFHAHIEAVKSVTHSPKVAIVGKCLGTNVVLAYIAKYGTDSIYGVALDGLTVNGVEIISEAINGKINLDGNAIKRMLIDCNAYDVADIDEFLIQTVDLATKSGFNEGFENFTEAKLYEKLEEGVTSALALSTVLTWPNYWATVTAEDYDTAIDRVFGPKDGEKYQQYKGLIEKLDNYNVQVRRRIPELMRSIKDAGANLAVIAKYGCQIIPISESDKLIGDQLVSVGRASFGATSNTVYEPLSDEYIAQRVAEGKGKYISPDKQIDASTCLFPDYTWFIKGNKHSNWSWHEQDLLYTVVTADRQLTVDDFEFSQFTVYNKENNFADKMTTENCNTEAWEADYEQDYPTSFSAKLKSFVESLIVWLSMAFDRMIPKEEPVPAE